MTDNNLRVLLDNIEEYGETKAELEQAIEMLKNENVALQITIQALKQELEMKEFELKNNKKEIIGDTGVLKEIITSQRRDLRLKDKQIEILRDLVDKLSDDIEKASITENLKNKLSEIPGIGLKIEQRLKEIGVETFHDLMDSNATQLAGLLPGIGIKSIKKWKTFIINKDENIRSQYRTE